MEVAGMSDVAASVRLLGRDDVAPMRSMLAMFGEAFDEGRAYSDRPPGAAWLQRLLGSDAFIAIAAMKDDEMVGGIAAYRSEEHTSELQSLMRISYAVFCLKKKKKTTNNTNY